MLKVIRQVGDINSVCSDPDSLNTIVDLVILDNDIPGGLRMIVSWRIYMHSSIGPDCGIMSNHKSLWSPSKSIGSPE